MRRKILFFALIWLCSLGPAHAHFTMVFPGKHVEVSASDYLAKLGETKTLWILWGHPYEHQLFDCPVAPEVSLRDPEGNVEKLEPKQITVEGKIAYEVSFTVEKMGDYVVFVKLEVPEHDLVDYTKAVIHCGEEAWFGWDAEVGQEVEIIPYTRPYGIEEGFVFTGKALYNGEPLVGASVEVEKYHTKEVAEQLVEEAEKKFAWDPAMMYTRVTTTNEKGEFAYTLDEAGIWFIGATKEVEDGLDKRGVLIVPVFEEFPKETIAPTKELESLEDRVSSLESKVGSIKPISPSLAYSAIGISIIAILLAFASLTRKKV